MTLLLACGSTTVSAQEEWTMARAVISVTDAPLFRLPLTEGIPLESNFIVAQEGEPAEGEGEEEGEGEGDEESGTDALFLFRIGVAYSFEFGERYSITPGLELDFINEEDEVATALVYGVSFGIGF